MSELVRRRCPLCRHVWDELADLPVKKRARCRRCHGRRPKRPGPPRTYPKIRPDPRTAALEERRLRAQTAAWGLE